MTRRILTLLVLAAFVAFTQQPGVATAQAYPNEQLIRSVERELPEYVDGVDVRSLSPGQVAALHLALHSEGSRSEIRGNVLSIIGGLDVLLFGRNMTFTNTR